MIIKNKITANTPEGLIFLISLRSIRASFAYPPRPLMIRPGIHINPLMRKTIKKKDVFGKEKTIPTGINIKRG